MLTDKPCLIDLDSYPSDFSPCHKRVLSARNIAPQQCKKALSELLDVSLLHHAKSAASLIYECIQSHQKIVVVGDYDADGATSIAVTLSVLQYLNANVEAIIPHRVTMGYGLSDAVVSMVIDKGADLVLTVDNGINAVSAVERLKSHQIQVIISDHHIAPQVLPQADYIVNPNQPHCDFPDHALAGVGVAFYLMLALRQVYRESDDDKLANYPMADLLPLVALGTIADLVPLSFNNRILVEQGLKRIRNVQGNVGLQALIEIAGIDSKQLNSTDLAFYIAPRLNAAGRIADMQLGVDCLMANSYRLAMDYALALDKLNSERKSIENEMKIEAIQLLKSYQPEASGHVICLYEPHWNEGLIGIVAARLTKAYHKTTFVFTRTEQGIKGSARAIDAVNVVEALNQINYHHPNLLKQYGGHAKAAGLSMLESDLPAFKDSIESMISKQLANVSVKQTIDTDGTLLPYEMNIDNAKFLKTFEVWGMQSPEPVFRNTFYMDSIREVGKNHAQMQLIESQSGKVFKGIAFDKFESYQNLTHNRCQVAYQLSINHWQGKQSLSLTVLHAEEIT